MKGAGVVVRKLKIVAAVLAVVLLLSGCTLVTVDRMYSPPKRSAEYEDLQRAIDKAMTDMSYSSPLSGENRQTVQMADLDGDGTDEYLLFAKDASEKPMKVLIFRRDLDGCRLIDTIASGGSDFDLVEYVDLDNNPGLELVVGCRVSEMLLRSVSVYSFSDGTANQMFSVNYSKLVPVDLDSDSKMELLVITRGESDEDNAIAMLYDYQNGEIARSHEASLSESSEKIKRIMVGKLHNGVPAVYVASSVENSAIITDVFALKNGRFANISFSNESGTSVQTLRNYYVYADDIDNDGVLELPDLIDMIPIENAWMASNQKLIRWYAMSVNGDETDKMYTFHNFDGGWYLQLDKFLISRLSVVRQDNSFVFYLWDENLQAPELLMTILTLTGHDQNKAVEHQGFYTLYESESTLYTVKTETIATELGLLPEILAQSFQLIQPDWKNGET